MRPKVVIPVLLLSVAIALAVLFMRPGRDQSHLLASPEAETASATDPSRQPIAVVREDNRSLQPAISQSDPTFDRETPEDYATRRIAELMDLAMSDDPASLSSILPELNNSDPRIREAAVMAAVQFKSPDAIPALQDAYARADDPEEKIRLAKAIDFLTVPAESQIAGQAN